MATLCPQTLAHGSCNDQSCTFNHNILTCEPCKRIFITARGLQVHQAGKKHEKVVSGRSAIVHCPACGINMNTTSWKHHTAGRRHRKALKKDNTSSAVEPEEGIALPGMSYCELCQSQCTQARWEQHIKSLGHCMREKYMAFKAALDEAEKDKNGITIPTILDFGILDDSAAQSGVDVQHSIKTLIPTSQVLLVSAELASAKGKSHTSSFSVKVQDGTRIIKYSQSTTFVVSFRHSIRGRFYDRLDFIFEDVQTRKRFLISRSLAVVVGNRDDHHILQPIAPYKPRPRGHKQREIEVVAGVQPPSLEAIPWQIKLPVAKIPESLARTLSSGPPSDVIPRLKRTLIPNVLNTQTYERFFQYLLWVEEYRMEHDLETYDILDAKLASHRPYHYLEVPGLAENRPSVLVGDTILFQKHGAREGHWFEGFVHVVRKLEVGVRFHASFGAYSNQQIFNVRFKLNRYPMRRQHQALHTAFTPEHILFPLATHTQTRTGPPTTFTVINPLIGTNPSQMQAVSAIINQKRGNVPFIVFGPPGTGKTVTIVEAILQLLRKEPQARILACAPSNSAADLIAMRLAALSTDELFRFYAPSRQKDKVPDVLQKYSYWRSGVREGDHGSHALPPLARVKQFRVIVTTCVSAAFAYGVGMTRGHFTHIFFDEAGQATEPEIMIAVKTMADNSTNVILSGDPKQLGPVIRSNIAQSLGLSKSYLERLMDNDIYDSKKGHGKTVVKLVKNYRSHNAILKFPNEQFYKGELEQCADPKVINSYVGSPHLVSKDFPIVFHAISGKDDREASSPSFFNIDEASLVKEYVRALRSDNRYRITDSEIGVIAPYHAQCLKIRNILRAVADGVKVGSVEEFQGQERRVIIISTVRSSRDFIQYDLKHTLGFVANPRRFNVAVTRAKALLLVIGDPAVLSLDPLWRAFLNYIHRNGGWKGQPITWDPSAPVEEDGKYDQAVRNTAEVDMNEFTKMMESMTLAGVEEEADDAANPELNVDKPWRELE